MKSFLANNVGRDQIELLKIIQLAGKDLVSTAALQVSHVDQCTQRFSSSVHFTESSTCVPSVWTSRKSFQWRRSAVSRSDVCQRGEDSCESCNSRQVLLFLAKSMSQDDC